MVHFSSFVMNQKTGCGKSDATVAGRNESLLAFYTAGIKYDDRHTLDPTQCGGSPAPC
jgi:hypothetical protein